jgi:hypothetical protein
LPKGAQSRLHACAPRNLHAPTTQPPPSPPAVALRALGKLICVLGPLAAQSPPLASPAAHVARRRASAVAFAAGGYVLCHACASARFGSATGAAGSWLDHRGGGFQAKISQGGGCRCGVPNCSSHRGLTFLCLGIRAGCSQGCHACEHQHLPPTGNQAGLRSRRRRLWSTVLLRACLRQSGAAKWARRLHCSEGRQATQAGQVWRRKLLQVAPCMPALQVSMQLTWTCLHAILLTLPLLQAQGCNKGARDAMVRKQSPG